MGMVKHGMIMLKIMETNLVDQCHWLLQMLPTWLLRGFLLFNLNSGRL